MKKIIISSLLILICISLFSQNKVLGKYFVRNTGGYLLYKLKYDSNYQSYLIDYHYFIDYFNDTFNIVTNKTFATIKSKNKKLKKKKYSQNSKGYNNDIYSFYQFSFDTSGNKYQVDTMTGKYYENKSGELFIVFKSYYKSLLFINPKSNLFKFGFSESRKSNFYIYMITPLDNLKTLDDNDLNKLQLFESRKKAILFTIL